MAVVLVAALTVWTILSALVQGGSPRPIVAVLFATTVAFMVGRVLGAFSSIVFLSVVMVALIMAAISPGDLFGSRPVSGPFGYVNAKGAFLAQAAIAAMLLVLMTRHRVTVALGIASIIIFFLAILLSRSYAAALLVSLLPAVALIVLKRKGGRAAVIACSGAFALVLTGTIIAGATYTPRAGSRLAETILQMTLSERRPILWHESLAMMRAKPLFGVGPGRFGVESPTARSDPDASFAHQEFLQMGAETGIVGFALVVLLFLWGFARLGRSHGSEMVIALGAASLAALGIHSSIDYILHFPAIPIAAAALVGAATGSVLEIQPARVARPSNLS